VKINQILIQKIHFRFFRRREESLTIKTKYLVYKGCKKNVHRLWKMNGGGDGKGKSFPTSTGKLAKSSAFFGGLHSREDDKIKKMTDQTIQENIRTTEKMNQLKLKMELVNARKKLKSIKFPMRAKNKGATADVIEKQDCNDVADLMSNIEIVKPLTAPGKTKDHSFIEKVIQKQQKPERNLSAESKMKIKENLSRNRSFKTILSQPEISTSSSSMSLFNNEINPLEFCFATNATDVFTSTSSGNKLGRSLSFQSNYIHRTDSNLCVNTSLAAMEATTISNSTPIIQEYVEHITEAPTGTKVKEPLPKTGYSTSMQDLLLQEFLTKSSASSHFQLTPAKTTAAVSKTVRGRDFSSANITTTTTNYNNNNNNAGSALKSDEKVDMFKGTAITKVSPSSTGDEYFILPKLLIREDSPILEAPLGIVKESITEDLLDVAAEKQPSAESLIEFYENLTSSSTSSLASKINEYECFHHQPPSGNRFYHSDLDLNQLNDRFKNSLSISNLNINTTSEGNLGGSSNVDAEWPRSNLLLLSINQTIKDDPQPSNYNVIEDVNYDKFLNDLLNNDISSGLPAVLKDDSCSVKKQEECPNNDYDSNNINNDDDSLVKATATGKDNETIDLFTSDLDNVLMKKMSARRIAPLKKPIDKLKSFSSNPQLGNHHHHHHHSHESSNLAATTSTVHIPQLSRLDAIPTKYRRGICS
jgi:hypothetical protein